MLKRVLLPLILVATAPFMLAQADTQTEAFVEQNAMKVINALDDPELDPTQRIAQFNAFMDEFANLDGIARFVLGKYSRRFSAEELARYREVYRAYSLANYETQFDDYRGASIEVTGSRDEARYSVVNSIIRTSEGDEQEVSWHVRGKDGKYKIVDVGLNLDGNLLWLAVEQRAQFLDLLDRNGGSASALISKLEDLTAELEADSRG